MLSGKPIAKPWKGWTTLNLLLCLSLPVWAQLPAPQVLSPVVYSLNLLDPSQPERTPVLYINGNQPLELSFDITAGQNSSLELRISRLEANGEASRLPELNWLEGYPTLPLQPTAGGGQRGMGYVSYSISLPWRGLRLKMSGLYLLTVYPRNNPNAPLLQQPLLVAESGAVALSDAEVLRGQAAGEQRSHQVVNFAVAPTGVQVRDARRELKVFVMQNLGWQQARGPLRADGLQGNRLLYINNPELSFAAGNEFRLFDTRQVNLKGFGVSDVRCQEDVCDVYVQPDRPQGQLGYLAQQDQNGLYLTGQTTRAAQIGTPQAEYARVHFRLETGRKLSVPVYVLGRFTQGINPNYQLDYDAQAQAYTGVFLLKQGLYNYRYATTDADGQAELSYTEGNYFDAENTYQVLVFYRPFSERSDRLLGVLELSSRR